MGHEEDTLTGRLHNIITEDMGTDHNLAWAEFRIRLNARRNTTVESKTKYKDCEK